jgi:hypothetical protein
MLRRNLLQVCKRWSVFLSVPQTIFNRVLEQLAVLGRCIVPRSSGDTHRFFVRWALEAQLQIGLHLSAIYHACEPQQAQGQSWPGFFDH